MVVYLVCYDLSASPEHQTEQLSYWLNFLHSSLSGSAESKSKWQVMIVGTKRDVLQPEQLVDPIPTWQEQWPSLPLHKKHFMVSSHKMQGVKGLLKDLTHVCNSIFEQHCLAIPRTYKLLAESVKLIPLDECVIPISQLKASHWAGKDNQFTLAVKYLHSIGRIIVLGGALVCPSPQIIPKIISEFISPVEVCSKLLVNHNVAILTEQQIGMLLRVLQGTKEYYYSCFFLSFFSFFLSFFLSVSQASR
jgi:hypothetical protein